MGRINPAGIEKAVSDADVWAAMRLRDAIDRPVDDVGAGTMLGDGLLGAGEIIRSSGR